MEQYFPKKQNPLKALALAEIGLFELGFIVAILLLIFGTLNYFNILSVSEVFPQYLGWLPSLRTKNIYTKSIKNDLASYYSSSLPKPTPKPEETAKKLLTDYLSGILNFSITPTYSSIELTRSNNSNSNFTARWINADKISSVAIFDAWIGDNPPYIYLSISKDIDVKTSSLSAELSEKTFSDFFSIKPKGVWGCVQSFGNTYCENFWEEKVLKRGIGMTQSTLGPNHKTLIASFCEFGKTSSLYDRKSCVIQFAKTGVLTNP